MYYLFKSDPDEYSLHNLQEEITTIWDGVHNFQAINFIKQTKVGDQVFIYHSLSDKAIVGLAEVVDQPFENKADSRTSWAVKIKFIKKFNSPLTLSDIKQADWSKDFLLVRNSRLSIMPVEDLVAQKILKLVG